MHHLSIKSLAVAEGYSQARLVAAHRLHALLRKPFVVERRTRKVIGISKYGDRIARTFTTKTVGGKP